MTPLEKIKTAIRETRTLEYEDDDTLNTIATAALNALKDLDQGTLEAMKVAFTKSLMADGSRNGLVCAYTAAIDHILKDGEP